MTEELYELADGTKMKPSDWWALGARTISESTVKFAELFLRQDEGKEKFLDWADRNGVLK